MIKISNTVFMKTFMKLLILIVIAKAIAVGIWVYLPDEGVELSVKKNYHPKYQRVNFINTIKKPEIVVPKVVKEPTIGITSMLLKGFYGTDTQGFVIVAMKSNPKLTSIIAIGEDYKGYTLKSIKATSAIFLKDGNDYELKLEEPQTTGRAITKVQNLPPAPEFIPGVPTGVSRNDISYFAKNPKEIWKSISISEVKQGGKITGFKVTNIVANSKFAALGLQKGDIIIKANNVRLQSYRDALEIYKNISKIDTMQIVVLRNNQEMELVYEIN